RASRPAETQDLHRLIRQAIDGAEGPPRAISLSRETAIRPLSVVVAPLAAKAGSQPVAVLLIADPDRLSLPTLETVMRLFDLTEAEGRLALALAQGNRIEDAAEQLGITISSARTYLKRVFSKTGADRQAELVRLIVGAPSLLDLGS
ncbi:MAG TPA: helix-turn-helix transcriptional regulator, partial [Rhodospirillaceae bacterium]|nr:helix-turn-helix transcriptional regulator [Rhodospirillaceae bacterium]